jgi:hypothetical protein
LNVEIYAEPDAVVATATALLALADDVDDVAFSHGEKGAIFIVPQALADKLVSASATAKPVEPVELETPPPRKYGPRAKAKPDQEQA